VKKTSAKSAKSTMVILHELVAEDVLLLHYGIEENSSDGESIGETLIEFGDEDLEFTDLLHEKSRKSRRAVMFLDPNKAIVKMWGNMIDVTQNGALPRYTTKPCWWCRGTFNSHPIGCPIRYNPNKPPGRDRDRVLERLKEANLPLDSGTDFFETEGLFCTFPCVKSYILDESSRTKSPKYKRAMTLLTLLYQKLLGEICVIPTAGSWKVLTDWGGHLTPQEFRATTGLLEYTETVNTRRPLMYSSSVYVQEKRVKI